MFKLSSLFASGKKFNKSIENISRNNYIEKFIIAGSEAFQNKPIAQDKNKSFDLAYYRCHLNGSIVPKSKDEEHLGEFIKLKAFSEDQLSELSTVCEYNKNLPVHPIIVYNNNEKRCYEFKVITSIPSSFKCISDKGATSWHNTVKVYKDVYLSNSTYRVYKSEAEIAEGYSNYILKNNTVFESILGLPNRVSKLQNNNIAIKRSSELLHEGRLNKEGIINITGLCYYRFSILWNTYNIAFFNYQKGYIDQERWESFLDFYKKSLEELNLGNIEVPKGNDCND